MTAKKNKTISVVIPAYCEEENLVHLLPRIIQTIKLTKLTYEVFYIYLLMLLLIFLYQLNYYKLLHMN